MSVRPAAGTRQAPGKLRSGEVLSSYVYRLHTLRPQVKERAGEKQRKGHRPEETSRPEHSGTPRNEPGR